MRERGERLFSLPFPLPSTPLLHFSLTVRSLQIGGTKAKSESYEVKILEEKETSPEIQREEASFPYRISLLPEIRAVSGK